MTRARSRDCTDAMKKPFGLPVAFICAVLFLRPAMHAADECPVEVKLLLSPPTVHTVIASLRFGKEIAGRVYFFDTDALDLLRQGVIVRVRQGADNDLTVKVRVPGGDQQADTGRLREHFPCAIDQTGAGEDTDYSVRRKFKVLQAPDMGSDIISLLSPPQQRLLQDARVSTEWGQVKRIADIRATKWESTAQSPFRKLVLELWEWPTGSILELSTKVGPHAGPSAYTELQRLVALKGLPLSERQGTKTSIVLKALTHQVSP